MTIRTKFSSIFIIPLVAACFFGAITITNAEECNPETDSSCYKLLAPLPLSNIESGQVNNQTTPADYVANIVKLAIGVASIIAVLKIIFAGFKYVTVENFQGKSSAKDDIQKALIGLFLAIGAFTILQTINPKLVDLGLTIDQVGIATSINDPGACAGAIINGQCTPCTVEMNAEGKCNPTTKLDSPTGTVWANDNNIRSQLILGGIQFNHIGNCKTVGAPNCTSVTGLSATIVSSLINLKDKCKCMVIITGGTEYWLHSAGTQHRPGGHAVDLSLTSDLHKFLKTDPESIKMKNSGGCSVGDEVYRYKGGTFVNETIEGNAPHWHVCY